MIIDSHCHLDYDVLFDELDKVLLRAASNKVNKMLTICTTLKSFEKIKVIIEKHDNIYGTFGIHPHESEKHKNINSNFIQNLKKKYNKVIGIGETGLDFFYNHSDKKVQKNSFTQHINAAVELNIPIIVHSRNAESETYDILKSEKKNSNLKILLHCFTGSSDFAKKLIDIGSYISVSGIITFSKSKELAHTVSKIPIENLLVETDSPYLSPEPNRGKSNEPSFIIHTINKLAEIKNISKENVISNTTKNFNQLFQLK